MTPQEVLIENLGKENEKLTGKLIEMTILSNDLEDILMNKINEIIKLNDIIVKLQTRLEDKENA